MMNKKRFFLPVTLIVLAVCADQISKALAVKHMIPNIVFCSFFGDIVQLKLVYNPGAAFSIGAQLGFVMRWGMLCILPLVFLIVLTFFCFKPGCFTAMQRWFLCGIIGGGFGNLIDRFLRSGGVVDFIDIKFFGIFGLPRWPTFNIADSFIVCCGIAFVLGFLFQSSKNKEI